MRIVIGEDSALFREGLARLLEDAGHMVVAKAADAPSLMAAVEATRPDLVIIDVRMPPDRTDDGARAARALRDRDASLAIVLLSQHIESKHSVELVASGHFGYLLKDRVFDVDDFLDTLRRVAAGGSALDPEVVATLLGPSRRSPLALLTARELLREAEGVVVVDGRGEFITPAECVGEYAVFVSRLRKDPTVRYGLNMWVVADNLRKGAALNAIQIAEAMVADGLI
jgi:DNA-binding NarL/FixJ family response regulator